MAWSDWNPLNLLKPKPSPVVFPAAPLSGEPVTAGRRRRTRRGKKGGRKTRRARK